MKRGIGLVCGCLLAAAPRAATAREDSQLWTAQSIQIALGDGFQASVDTALRFGDAAGGLSQVRIAPMLSYEVSKGIVLGIGYVDAPDYSHGRRADREQRWREQAGLDIARLAGGQLSTTLRSEQRWRDTGPGTGWRARVMVRWTRPLGGNRAPSVIVSHESFYNLNSTTWGQRAGYDRMRNYLGLAQPLGKFRLEAGYLQQRIAVRHGADEQDNILSLAISVKL